MTRNGTILVVDDDFTVLQLTCDVLEEAGLTTVAFTSVAEAMSYMAENPGATCALFTDINLMTPMSGIELAIFVTQEWPNVAVGVTSGVARDRPKRLPDCARFFPKPWQSVELVAFARDAIRGGGDAA